MQTFADLTFLAVLSRRGRVLSWATSVGARKKPARGGASPKRKKLQRPPDDTAAAGKPAAGKDRKLKYDSSGMLVLNVALTGARVGDVLAGASPDNNGGVVLKVVSGQVKVSAKIIRSGGFGSAPKADVIAAIQKWRGTSLAKAEQMYADIPREPERANHQPIGKACRCEKRGGGKGCECAPEATLMILQPGKLMEFAEEAGPAHAAAIVGFVSNQTEITWKHILAHMGKHTLVLRPRIYQVTTGPRQLEPSELDGVAVIDATFGAAGGSAVFNIAGFFIRVIKQGGDRLGPVELPSLVLKAAAMDANDANVALVEDMMARLKPLTNGALKSLVQKCVRFGAPAVGLPDGVSVPTAVVVATAAALLMASSGGFSPELQMFTRGCSAAFKRIAVILVEDAWSGGDGAAGLLCPLLATALYTQTNIHWHPTEEAVVAALVVCVQAANSQEMVNWRGAPVQAPRAAQQPPAGFRAKWKPALGLAAQLLVEVKSFAGDIKMMHKMAALKWSFVRAPASARPALMPLCHLVDQHTYRGVAHAMDSAVVGADFAEAFKLLFNRCTGVNYRYQDASGFEERAVVKECRKAQKAVLGFALKVPRQLLDVTGHSDTQMRLDPGVLAAAVGPVEIKIKRRNLIVTLGVVSAEDEMVMLRPARSTDDLYSSVTDAERSQAINAFRAQRHRLKSPLLKGTAEFDAGLCCWCVNKVPWHDIVATGLKTSVPTHPAPPADPLDFRQYLHVTGDGMVAGARLAVNALLSKVPMAVRLRALSLLRQQFEEVHMPTPSLHGKIGADQLMCYPKDGDVYRLLVSISRLVPGALRPMQVPKFAIPNPLLVRELEGWIGTYSEIAQATAGTEVGAAGKPVPVPSEHNLWRTEQWKTSQNEMSQNLKQHQRDAVSDMDERDGRGAPGHFLVMDVGYGKTLTSLAYAAQWLRSGNGVRTKYILWTTPGHIVKSTELQIRSKWKAPTHIVDRKLGKLKPYAVNVIDQDYLRVLVERFVPLAPQMLIVFDEVDQLYGNTLRTSAARQLAQLCMKMICQTATPMTSTKDERLAQWLGSTELYPVTKTNWLVAANGMVSKQIDLGIDVAYEERFVELTDPIRQAHLHSGNDWLKMARATQRGCDTELVRTAKAHAGDGVLLVADSEKHAETLLAALAQSAVVAGGFDDLADRSKSVIVITKRQNRGYNEAVRLGCIVTGVYAGNAAARHQLTGRLLRMGQKRSSINHITVMMRHTILELLHFRHKSVDTMNISLQSLGDKYGKEVLEGLV